MLPSARLQIAGERKGSRWDQARLVMPIGVIVVVAIMCVVVAVLTSAQRADEVAFNSEQQLIKQSIANHGHHALRLVESVADTPRAAVKIRDSYDPQWADRRIGQWLARFNFDVVAIVGADDSIEYAHSDAAAVAAASDLPAELAPSIALLRGRLTAMPAHAVDLLDGQNPTKPGRSAVLVENFLGKPALVAAVAVGSDADLAHGNDHAPIVIAVKYIGTRLLDSIGGHLQLTDLRRIDDPAQAGNDRALDLADAHGNAVARLAWKPTRPGGAIVASVVPFIAVALTGFALFVGLVHPLYAAHRGRTCRR